MNQGDRLNTHAWHFQEWPFSKWPPKMQVISKYLEKLKIFYTRQRRKVVDHDIFHQHTNFYIDQIILD